MRKLFSSSFDDNTIDNLDSSLNMLHETCKDEFIVLFNIIKYATDDVPNLNLFSKEQLNIVHNATKAVDTIDKSERLLYSVNVMGEMFEKIENEIKLNNGRYSSINVLFGSTSGSNDNDRLEIIKGGIKLEQNNYGKYNIYIESRETVLIACLLVLFKFYNVNVFIKNIENNIGNTDELLHNLVHLMNDEYNEERIKNMFNIVQGVKFIQAVKTLLNWNGEKNKIDIQNLNILGECSLLGDDLEFTFSLVILSGIYAFNSKYDWFNFKLFEEFINKHGNAVKTLGVFLTDKENYNVMYALGILYSLRFINVLQTNEKNVVELKLNDLSINDFKRNNGAFVCTINNHSYVLEMQDYISYIAVNGEKGLINQQLIINDKNESNVVSFIVRNVRNNKELNNIDHIVYSLNDLKKVISSYQDNKSYVEKKVQKNINVDDFEKMIRVNNITGIILKIGVVALIVGIVVFFVYTSKHDESMKFSKNDIGDLSLIFKSTE